MDDLELLSSRTYENLSVEENTMFDSMVHFLPTNNLDLLHNRHILKSPYYPIAILVA